MTLFRHPLDKALKSAKCAAASARHLAGFAPWLTRPRVATRWTICSPSWRGCATKTPAVRGTSQQSFTTIAPYTIEEAYEVADAIAREDLEALKDELGDLLLQVVYHAQMASEDGQFTFTDVADAIARKMIRRHPHVFGDADRDAFLTGNMWRAHQG